MTVTVPSTDVVNYALQTQITNLTTMITNNPLLASSLTQLQQQLQYQLVQNLIAAAVGAAGGSASGNSAGVLPSHLQPATILSTCTVNT